MKLRANPGSILCLSLVLSGAFGGPSAALAMDGRLSDSAGASGDRYLVYQIGPGSYLGVATPDLPPGAYAPLPPHESGTSLAGRNPQLALFLADRPDEVQSSDPDAKNPWIASGLSLGVPVLGAFTTASVGGGLAAVLLSPLLLGSGHIYAGDPGRGFSIGLGGVAFPLIGSLLLTLVGLPVVAVAASRRSPPPPGIQSAEDFTPLLILFLPLAGYYASLGFYVVYSVVDAFSTAETHNKRLEEERRARQ